MTLVRAVAALRGSLWLLKRRCGMAGALAGVGLVFVVYAAIPQVQALRVLQVGDSAPDFAARDLEGKLRERDSLMGEKGMLLLFWASWSPRAMEELPFVDGLRERYGQEGISFVAVNVEGQRPDPRRAEMIQEIVEREGFGLQMLVDHRLEVFGVYGVIAVPSTVLLDADGRIVYALDGFRPGADEELEGAIRAALGFEVAEAPPIEAPKLHPKALRYFNLGKVLYQKGFFDKALRNFDEAASYDSTATEIQLWIGQVLVKLDRLDEAEAALSRAVEGDSYVDLAYVLMAEVALASGEPAAALTDAEKALEVHPDYPRALEVRGRALAATGDLDGAAAALSRAVELNPLVPDSYYFLAQVYLQQGNKAEALKTLRQGLQVALGLDSRPEPTPGGGSSEGVAR